MSSFLCFICHNTLKSDINEDTRDKYRELVGINLCPDSHLCHICCHMLNKLWLFKSVCLKRSLEYPVLFSEKGTLNLQRTEIENIILCSEENCIGNNITHVYIDNKDQSINSNDYMKLEYEQNDFKDYFSENKIVNTDEILEETKSETDVDKIPDENEFEDNNTDELTCSNDEEDKNEEAYQCYDDERNDCLNEIRNENLNEEGEELESPKTKKTNKKDFEKILLSVEEQKSQLEAQRKSKKYLDAEFKCYNCGLGFLFKDTYQAHMMRHEESNGEYRCALCSLRFATGAVLRSHAALHSVRYRCERCGQYIRARQTHTHAKYCHNKASTASCHLCGRVFQAASGLQQHLKRFHMTKKSKRSYSCSVCGKNYGNQAAVRTHMIKHIHRKFSCDQCDSSFSSPYTLTQHKKKHTMMAEDQQFCCSCGVTYGTKKSLLAHMRNSANHQQRAYECPMCNRSCPNERSLTSHISTVHSATKPFCCPSCTARYSSRKSLVRHMRSHTIPPQAKLAVCHICGNSFKGKSKLNRHLREVCEKDKLEEELSAYYEQQNVI